jgi:methylmalonyl-CoA mutase cobalamin-binding subunit
MSTPKPRAPASTGFSIGALSRAVGVPVQTLRTWESRYGFPTGERLPSGHRRYPPETVERLRLVGRLLEQGHKPSSIVSADPATLRRLLDIGSSALPVRATPPPTAGSFTAWFDAVQRFDVAGLEAQLRHGWHTLGPLPFLEEQLSPFLAELGRAWSTGTLDVSHEHFASATIGLFLGQAWRSTSDAARGPLAVCATFEGERHELGLHMAAVGLAVAGWRIRFLGADTPIASIVAAVRATNADAVIIGASEGTDPDELKARLARLRRRLPAGTPVVAGGIAPPPGENHATWPGTIRALVEAVAGRAPEGDRRRRNV